MTEILQIPGARFRPIGPDWPGQLTAERVPSPFSVDWRTTVQQLWHELTELDARDVVAQVAVHEGQIRQDGQVYARAVPEHPGVLLAFATPHQGALRFACDRFLAYRDNVRAIGLALESLRRVDRYGIAGDHQQYRGYQAIEAPANGQFTIEQAAAFVAQHGYPPGGTNVTAGDVLDAWPSGAPHYRWAARRLHPDTGGDAALFVRLQEARRVLDDHAGAAR